MNQYNFIHRSILIVCLAAIVTPAVSQTQKGGWLLGGNAGTSWMKGKQSNENSSINSTTTKSFTITAGPSALYFVANNLAVGAGFDASYTTSKGTSTLTPGGPVVYTNKTRTTDFSFDPEIRKYFGKPGAKGQPWVNVFGGLNKGRIKQTWNYESNQSGESTNKYNGWNLGAGIGYSHFLNEHIALQYFVNYRHSYLKSANSPTDDDGYKQRDNSVNLGVGLQIHLKCKHA